ncbi:MAG: DNA-protecting protein DprA [Chloroflexi bacterium]|nr:DNA-protecting protein DprA [Chloroflexota bacterium]
MAKAHWLALAMTAQVGGKTMTRLLRAFGSLEAVFDASEADLQRIPHIGPHIARAIQQSDLAKAQHDLQHFQQAGIHLLTCQDTGYPANLLRCHDAPPVLLLRGQLHEQDMQAIAIVGTRQPSERGRQAAQQAAAQLGARGWTIVSGLALGIDTAAHRSALDVGARSLAVLGSGLNRVYPQRNQRLATHILDAGALLSEVHPDAEVSRPALVARNRITSGLSRAVLVIEASQDSGSQKTAQLARQQGRAVYWINMAEHQTPPFGSVLNLSSLEWDDFSAQLAQLQIEPFIRDDPPRLF